MTETNSTFWNACCNKYVVTYCLLNAQQNCMKSKLQINSGNVIEVLFLRKVTYQEFHFISMKVFFFISEPVSVFWQCKSYPWLIPKGFKQKFFNEKQRKQEWLQLLDRKRILVFQIIIVIIIIIIIIIITINIIIKTLKP